MVKSGDNPIPWYWIHLHGPQNWTNQFSAIKRFLVGLWCCGKGWKIAVKCRKDWSCCGSKSIKTGHPPTSWCCLKAWASIDPNWIKSVVPWNLINQNHKIRWPYFLDNLCHKLMQIWSPLVFFASCIETAMALTSWSSCKETDTAALPDVWYLFSNMPSAVVTRRTTIFFPHAVHHPKASWDFQHSSGIFCFAGALVISEWEDLTSSYILSNGDPMVSNAWLANVKAMSFPLCVNPRSYEP